MPQASAVRSSSAARGYAMRPFASSWQIGSGDTAWVRLAGELDIATSPQFRQTLSEAQRAARLVMLDLRELCFIDVSGVHVILDAACDSRPYGGRLLIVRGRAQVDMVLTLTEVSKQVVIFDLAPAEPAPSLFGFSLSGGATSAPPRPTQRSTRLDPTQWSNSMGPSTRDDRVTTTRRGRSWA
jgi:anti-anti-sigma factor